MTRAIGVLLGRIGVEPGERGLFGWSALCLFLVGAAAAGALASAETLFLKRVGVQYLPLALLVTSGVLVLTTGILGRVLVTADRSRWLTRVLLILAGLLVPLAWLLGTSDAPGVFAVFLLVARHIMAVGLLVFWISLYDIVTTRQAKRLFGPLAASLTLGNIAGSFATDPIARWLSVEGVVVAGAVALAGAALAGGRLHARHPHRVDRRGAGRGPAAHRGGGGDPIPVGQLWRDSPLFRLLSASLLCGGILSPVLFFEFSYVADAATQGPDGEARLLFLYANFRGCLNAAMLVTQLWLASRIYRTIGLPLAVGLWPASYLLGFVGLGVAPALPVGMGALGAGRLSEDGISGSALRVLYNLFPESIRSGASGLIEGPINRVGSMIGNGSAMAALAMGITTEISWLVLPIVLVWVGLSINLWRRYPKLLLQASADRHLVGVGADKAMLLDRGTVRALAPGLVDPDPRACRAAIDLIGDAEPRVAVQVFAEAIASAPALTRPLVVDALFRVVERRPAGSIDCPRALDALEKLFADPGDLSPEERADLLRSYARLAPDGTGRGRSLAVLDRALADRSAAVRLVAMAELHRRGRPPPGVVDIDALLRETLGVVDVSLRRSARHELRAMLLTGEPDARWDARLAMLFEPLRSRADRAETAEALVEIARVHGRAAAACIGPLLRHAGDRDPRVRAAVLRAIGLVGAIDHSHRLIAELGSRHAVVASAAREGLVALGPAITDPLLEAHEFGSRSTREGVLTVLRELDLDPAELHARTGQALERVWQAVLLRAALEAEPGAGLVRRRLEERVSAGIAAAFTLVSLREDDPLIAELERRIRRAGDERSRDLLIETLDAHLPDDARRDLLPLLEPGSWAARADLAAQRLGRRPPQPAAAWNELARFGDPLTQRMAAYFRPRDVEAGAGIGDAPGVLDPMEVAVQLQSVPVFDRLSTRQLVGLAEVLESVQLDAGEPVYREGDEGDGLYFILEGAVSLAWKGARRERLGPGSFFGELSTLDGVPRHETAVADEPLRLLRLDREELLVMMEEAPALGIGLSQFLSLRIRALRDREDGALAADPAPEPAT